MTAFCYNDRMVKTQDKNSIHKPRAWLYAPAALLCKAFAALWYGLEVTRSESYKKQQGPMLFIGNHVSYMDPVMMVAAVGQKPRLNFVAANFVMSKSFVRTIFRLVGVIPTTQFASSPSALRSILRIAQQQGSVAFYPEGERSNNGGPGKIDINTAKLIKHLKMPLAFCRLSGAYLTWPRWAPSKLYRGKCYAQLDLLLNAEQINALSVEAIHERLLKAFDYDDYRWQKTLSKPHRYRPRTAAVSLEKILLLCPHCNTLGQLHSQGQNLQCAACESTWQLEADGFFKAPISNGAELIHNPGEWYALQKQWLAAFRDAQPQNELRRDKARLLSQAIHTAAAGVAWETEEEGVLILQKDGLSFISNEATEAKTQFFPFAFLSGMMLEHGAYVQCVTNKRINRFYLEESYVPALIRLYWELFTEQPSKSSLGSR